MSHEVRREIFERGHAAVLLPFDPVRDEVVLIEQIRIAAYDTSETPRLLEMVAGMMKRVKVWKMLPVAKRLKRRD